MASTHAAEQEGNKRNKRTDNISWDEYFMGMALISAMRSKDPQRQVGACISNSKNKVAGLGYNGMPNGCSDDKYPWGKDPHNKLNDKLTYVCHAELNAILNRNLQDLDNCRIYVTLFPCNECAKAIIQSGISEVIYLSDKNAAKPKVIAAKTMFDDARVNYRRFTSSRSEILLKFQLHNEEEAEPPNDVMLALTISN